MPKYRLMRKSPASLAGINGGDIEERVIELPAGMAPPPGAQEVADNAPLSAWTPKAPEAPEEE